MTTARPATGSRAALPFVCLVLAGCAAKPTELPVQFAGEPLTITVPLGLPPLPANSNPPTAAAVALGKRLFFDPRLSRDGTVACATCHDPERGFAEGRAVSTGVAGRQGRRNAPSARNAVFLRVQFWDGRAATLEDQARGPLLSPLEMDHSAEGIVRRCEDDPATRQAFIAAFGNPPSGTPVSLARVVAALGAYERTLLRGNSPFDRFLYGNDGAALSAEARRGWDVFRQPAKGNCVSCHLVGSRHALFTDHQFHNLGVGMNRLGELTDPGRYAITKAERDRGAFRTPSLRDVALTAPYMHDGSLRTLKEVVDFYVGGGNGNDHLDPQIKPLTHLTRQERSDLVAFLTSLTGAGS